MNEIRYRKSNIGISRIVISTVLLALSIGIILILAVKIYDNTILFSAGSLIALVIAIICSIAFGSTVIMLYRDCRNQREYFNSAKKLELTVQKTEIRINKRELLKSKTTKFTVKRPDGELIIFYESGDKSNTAYVLCQLYDERKIINILEYR